VYLNCDGLTDERLHDSADGFHVCNGVQSGSLVCDVCAVCGVRNGFWSSRSCEYGLICENLSSLASSIGITSGPELLEYAVALLEVECVLCVVSVEFMLVVERIESVESLIEFRDDLKLRESSEEVSGTSGLV
jgi:hypothetical protein